MSPKKPHQGQPASPPGDLENTKDKGDGWRSPLLKYCDFFSHTLSPLEKLGSIAGIITLIGAVAYGGYWLGTALSASKLESKTAELVGKSNGLENEIANLKRKLDQSRIESEPTVDTAKSANRTYQEFLTDLDKARNQNAVAVGAIVDRYRGKRIEWDCAILETDPSGKWYRIGADDKANPRNQALARFHSDEFNPDVKTGERKRIEGVFRSADDSGIVLYDCRFVSEPRQR